MLLTALFSGGGLVLAGLGAWIASMFVPSFALLLKSALDFLKSPIGNVVAIGALMLFVFSSAWVGGDLHGTSETKAAWKADITKQAIEAAAREDALRKQMKALADGAIDADGGFGKQIDNEVSSYAKNSVKRPQCRASSDDVRRLRAIH
jgi:hypothetical protein